MMLEDYVTRCPLIAILRGVRPDEVVGIGQSLVDAGFSVIEVPMNSPDAVSSISRLSQALGSDILVGAGTVMDATTVEQIAASGGRLIVTPHADATIIRAAKDNGLVAVPGVLSPTEAFAMLEAGADALKLFPAEIAGPKGLKALGAVLPSDVRVFPVGGITPETMSVWWPMGAAGFGLGSALYKPGDSAETVSEVARRFIANLPSTAS